VYTETQQDNINKNNLKIAILENNVDAIKVLCSKLEKTIDGIHKLQADMSSILKLQELKIDVQDKENNDLVLEIAKNKAEFLSHSKYIRRELDAHVQNDLEMHDNFQKKLSEFDDSLEKKLKEKLEEIKLEIVSLRDRIIKIERWHLILLGGFILGSFLIVNSDKILSMLKLQ